MPHTAIRSTYNHNRKTATIWYKDSINTYCDERKTKLISQFPNDMDSCYTETIVIYRKRLGIGLNMQTQSNIPGQAN